MDENESAEVSDVSTPNDVDENMASFNGFQYYHDQPPKPTNNLLIDKDDPRSKLHYIKYLKRDGKTLKVWECGLCSKEFRHQYTLMRHLPTHTDERNFKCDACGKAFRQLSTLSQHKAIHSDARPYICEYCQKTFNRISTLISHRKTHSENKPHICYICGKGFHQKGNLRNHVFTHTNERPYKCEICSKGFNQMSNLVCHKTKAHAHSETMQYTCNLCGKEFSKRSTLRSHEESEHDIKYRNSSLSTGDSSNKGRSSRNYKKKSKNKDDRNNAFYDTQENSAPLAEFMEEILIDQIHTKAMETALQQGHTAFALFKPAKGIPVLVKVSPSGSCNHLLTPATADDLKVSDKIDTITENGEESMQIKVPVVATIIEKVEDGKTSFIIEPPGPDQDQDILSCEVDEDQSFFKQEPMDDSISGESTSKSSQFPIVQDMTASDEELLELAEMSGIHFVRATKDGSFEVMTNSEARDLMAKNTHDVKILQSKNLDTIVDLPYFPKSSIPTKSTLIDKQQQQSPPQIFKDSSDIMVLDPNGARQGLSFGNLDILEDKDLRKLLNAKSLDDQYEIETDESLYSSQSKLEEMFANEYNKDIYYADENVTFGPSQTELSSAHIQNHPNGLAPNAASAILLETTKPQPPSTLSTMIDPTQYAKSCQSVIDDFSIDPCNNSTPAAIDYSTLPEYSIRLKLADFEDDSESIFFSLEQDATAKTYDNQISDDKKHNYQLDSKMLVNPISLEKVSLPVNNQISSQFGDFRFFNTCNQQCTTPMCDSNLLNYNSFGGSLRSMFPDNGPIKEDMQDLGKTFEPKLFSQDDCHNKENYKPFKNLDSSDAAFEHNEGPMSSVFSDIGNFLVKKPNKVKMDPTNFLHVNKFELDEWDLDYSPIFFP